MRAFSRTLLCAAMVGLCGVGCAPASAPRIARDDESDPAPKSNARPKLGECSIAGTMRVASGTGLEALRDGASRFAMFVDRPVALETTEVPAIGGARVRLVTTLKGGASFEGWMDTINLDFEAVRDIDLAGKTAYVPRGARVSIVVGAGRSVVVSPWTRDLARLEVTVDCDALALGPVPRDESALAAVPSGATSKEKTLALVSDELPVAATPGGDPVFTMHGGLGLRVQVIETRDGLHLHHEDGIVVDGWVRAEDLEVPTRHRLHPIGCGVGVAIATGMPALASEGIANRETPIFVGEAAGGAARGSLAKGGRVIVVRVDGTYAEILTSCGELVPAEKRHFWVEAAALEIGAKVPAASLRASCK